MMCYSFLPYMVRCMKSWFQTHREHNRQLCLQRYILYLSYYHQESRSLYVTMYLKRPSWYSPTPSYAISWGPTCCRIRCPWRFAGRWLWNWLGCFGRCLPSNPTSRRRRTASEVLYIRQERSSGWQRGNKKGVNTLKGLVILETWAIVRIGLDPHLALLTTSITL